jgi:hypothetical protein
VDLVLVLPPETTEPHLEPVVVFESADEFTIALAKGSLEVSGIPFWIQREGGNTTYVLNLNHVTFPLCRFLVPADHEEEARELLAPLQSSIEDERGA